MPAETLRLARSYVVAGGVSGGLVVLAPEAVGLYERWRERPGRGRCDRQVAPPDPGVWPSKPRAIAAGSNASAVDLLAGPLNHRELAILRLMAAGLPNQAIGAELALAVNMVRWYASQIFAKLAVRGRGAAVARARELGLLP